MLINESIFHSDGSDPQSFDVHLPKKTAVLVDLSFFLKVRYPVFKHRPRPADLAEEIRHHVLKTLRNSKDYLFRVFVYDCAPATGEFNNQRARSNYL